MTRLTLEEFNALVKKRGLQLDKAAQVSEPPRPSKYHNEKSEYYDPDLKRSLSFDSKKELEYYLVLKDRRKRGEISELSLQVPITIQESFIHNGKTVKAIVYRADFTYLDNRDGKTHIIDVKGSKNTLTEVYKLKKKLLLYRGYEIEEIF